MGSSLDHTHAGDPTVSPGPLRSLSAAGGHSSSGPLTPESGAVGHWILNRQGAPPHSARLQNLGNSG